MIRLASTVAAVCVIAFVAVGCGSDDSSNDSSAAQEKQSAVGGYTQTPATQAEHSYESFQLPSKNIACAMGKPGYARCDVQRKTFKSPAKPANCPLDWGTAIAVQGNGKGKFICHGDTVMNPGAPVLKYGESSAIGSVVCKSTKAGIHCFNEDTGHGFFLAKEKFRTI